MNESGLLELLADASQSRRMILLSHMSHAVSSHKAVLAKSETPEHGREEGREGEGHQG